MGRSKYIGHINNHGSEVIDSFSTKNKSGKSVSNFLVKCICGKEFKVIGQHFKSGATVSCGCVRQAQNLNLKGQIVNGLEVLEMLPPVPSDSRKRSRALVKCTCAKEFICVASELKRKRIKSCGCSYQIPMSIRRANNGGPSPQEKTWNWYIGQYKTSAKKRKLDFELNLCKFKELSQKKCYYCGLSPSPRHRYRNDEKVSQETIDKSIIHVNGIDRLDSNLGYIEINCVSCCTECNYHKGKYSIQQFNNWIQRIVTYRKDELKEYLDGSD